MGKCTPVLWQVPEGEGGCFHAFLPLGFADPDSGASGVRAAPAGGRGRQAWIEPQTEGAWLSLFWAQEGRDPSHQGRSRVRLKPQEGPHLPLGLLIWVGVP